MLAHITPRRVAAPGFIPVQARRHRRNMSGLAACPDFAPYETASGGCSNVEPGVDAHEYYQSGGSASDGVVSGADYAQQQQAVYEASLPATDAQIAAANNAARFGLQLTEDKATQDRLVAEFIKQANSMGKTAQCEVVMNSAPGAVSMWTSQCSLDGGEMSISPALALRDGGWAITLVEQAYMRGTPMVGQPAPVIVGGKVYYPSASNPQPWTTGGGTTPETRTIQDAAPLTAPRTAPAPAKAAPPPASKPPQTITTGKTTVREQALPDQAPGGYQGAIRTSEQIGNAVAARVNAAIPGAGDFISDIPMWAWAAGAVAAYYFLNRKGGRR